MCVHFVLFDNDRQTGMRTWPYYSLKQHLVVPRVAGAAPASASVTSLHLQPRRHRRFRGRGESNLRCTQKRVGHGVFSLRCKHASSVFYELVHLFVGVLRAKQDLS